MADEIDVQKGWTLHAYVAHNEALRAAELRFGEERDRRYTERDILRERALQIKETADLAALGLAREIQTYKDEKANELRTQIERERGSYATKGDLMAATEKIEETIKPLAQFVAAQHGRAAGGLESRALLFSILGLLAGAGLLILSRLFPS